MQRIPTRAALLVSALALVASACATAPTVREGESYDHALRRVADHYEPDILRCQLKATVDKPPSSGLLVLELLIDGNGKVHGWRVGKGGTLPQSAWLTQCVAAFAKTWKLPPPPSPGYVFTYRMHFLGSDHAAPGKH